MSIFGLLSLVTPTILEILLNSKSPTFGHIYSTYYKYFNNISTPKPYFLSQIFDTFEPLTSTERLSTVSSPFMVSFVTIHDLPFSWLVTLEINNLVYKTKEFGN